MKPAERSLLRALESWPGVRLAVFFGSAALFYLEESRAGIRPLRVFLEAVASAAGL